MTTLFLVRHCSVDYSGDISTDLNITLSTRGYNQARELAIKWNQPMNLIYSSTLPRAIETVLPLSETLNQPIQQLVGLKELEYNGNAPIFHQIVKPPIYEDNVLGNVVVCS